LVVALNAGAICSGWSPKSMAGAGSVLGRRWKMDTIRDEIERIIDALETRREQAEQAGQMEAASAFQYAIDLLRTVG